MDIQMPVMDGVEASIAIRDFEKANQQKHVHIVALTGNIEQKDRELYLNTGMNDYISKPISTEDIKQRVKKLFPAAPVA